ncbi:3'5'-cyclic nucleotide phosphodiesterase like protein [Aduncisulcus paluster]|uniref:3'5'-cyclic nucleotide phosphodiesterase like protein n=1 Tax=Aduncisulcus paluster TaxID=2918883 RepID=A0ABQ5KWA5_9EUKA|nr:3'5'-cyclic nucleotide phosphodiesterase like protein [Aduncisulcus paluster]
MLNFEKAYGNLTSRLPFAADLARATQEKVVSRLTMLCGGSDDRVFCRTKIRSINFEILNDILELCKVHSAGSNASFDILSLSFCIHDTNYTKSIPYHTNVHSASVTQHIVRSFLLLRDLLPPNSFSEMDSLLWVIATAGHDIRHPGLRKHVLEHFASPIVTKYGLESPLERHHVAVTLVLLRECAVFRHSEFAIVQRAIFRLILATSLDIQYEWETGIRAANMEEKIDSIWKQYRDSSKSVTLEQSEDGYYFPYNMKELSALIDSLAIALVKLSDISGPCRAHSAKMDRVNVYKEFMLEGDMLLACGIVPSRDCRRGEGFDIYRIEAEIGFLSFVRNLYQALAESLGKYGGKEIAGVFLPIIDSEKKEFEEQLLIQKAKDDCVSGVSHLSAQKKKGKESGFDSDPREAPSTQAGYLYKADVSEIQKQNDE